MRWIVLWAALLLPLDAIAEDTYTLLRFGADWCGPCRAMTKQFETKEVVDELAKRKLKVVYIDTDKDPNAVAVYQITALPTLILARELPTGGVKVVSRRTGYQSAASIIKFVEPAALRD
jgi:thiol-disulfide isomerase/thioredoxin